MRMLESRLYPLQLILICGILIANSFADPQLQGGDPHSSYAVIISEETYAQKDWHTVALTLKNKYHARIITYRKDASEAEKDAIVDMISAYFENDNFYVSTDDDDIFEGRQSEVQDWADENGYEVEYVF